MVWISIGKWSERGDCNRKVFRKQKFQKESGQNQKASGQKEETSIEK